MNKKVIILGGGTFNFVRCHMALAAPAFGETAKILYESCKTVFSNMDVELKLTKMADSTSDLVTNEDVEKYVDHLITLNTTKVIFFNVAMTDFEGQIGETSSGKYADRLKTKEGDVGMQLTPSRKVISKIRENRKDIFLVAFKTTAGASDAEMFAAGLNLLKKNSCNAVMVNDVVRKHNFIITPEEGVYYASSREQLLDKLVAMSYYRTHLSFTRSTVIDGKPVPWNDHRVYSTLRQVVNYCVSKGAYKEFNGATTGHFAAKIAPNEFLTSIRKTNFKDISKNGLVHVRTDRDGHVIAMGAKPSVGGQSQRLIFQQFEYTDCIVHFHCPLKEGHDDIQVMSQFEYECGSHGGIIDGKFWPGCAENTANGLRKHGNLYAVMLDNHGPNIVFHHSINPQEVIDFITKNFDLSKSTSGFEEVYVKQEIAKDMKIVNEMPTEGQFIRIWIHAGLVWSSTAKWEDGVIYEYDDINDEYVKIGTSLNYMQKYANNGIIQYVVLG